MVGFPPEAVIGPGCWYETIRYVVDGQANYVAKHLSRTPPRKVMVGRIEPPLGNATHYAEEIDGRSHGAIPGDA
jgi:hypothetical protein